MQPADGHPRISFKSGAAGELHTPDYNGTDAQAWQQGTRIFFESTCSRKLLCSMYTSCAPLNASLARIRSRVSGAVTMARFTIVTRGLAASGGGGLSAASPVAGFWSQACSSMSPPDMKARYWAAADSEHVLIVSVQQWTQHVTGLAVNCRLASTGQGRAMGTCALPHVSDPAPLLLSRQVPHAGLPPGARDAVRPAGNSDMRSSLLGTICSSMPLHRGQGCE